MGDKRVRGRSWDTLISCHSGVSSDPLGGEEFGMSSSGGEFGVCVCCESSSSPPPSRWVWGIGGLGASESAPGNQSIAWK